MFLFAHTVLEAEVCRVKLTFDGENWFIFIQHSNTGGASPTNIQLHTWLIYLMQGPRCCPPVVNFIMFIKYIDMSTKGSTISLLEFLEFWRKILLTMADDLVPMVPIVQRSRCQACPWPANRWTTAPQLRPFASGIRSSSRGWQVVRDAGWWGLQADYKKPQWFYLVIK